MLKNLSAHQSIQYQANIDGLRGIAILSVLLFHAFPNALPGGFVGVDIFFVISGYLISRIIFTELTNQTFSFGAFYARRVRRIFPTLILVLSACLIYGWFKLIPTEFEHLGKHIASAAAFISNIQLFREAGYFDTAATAKPLLNLWSLAVEEQFYLLWPLVAVFLFKKQKYALWTILAGLFASFSLNIYTLQHNASAVFYLPIYRFWELLLGALLALVQTQYQATGLRLFNATAFFKNSFINKITPQFSWLGLTALLVAFSLINTSDAFPGYWALLPTLGALLLIADNTDNWAKRNLVSNKALIWVGKISYPLYLWHWPLLTFARIENDMHALSLGMTLGLLLCSFILAYFTYKYFETPARFGTNLKAKTIWLCAGMGALFVFGVLIKATDGLPQRYSGAVKEIATYEFNYAEYRRGECFLNTEQQFTNRTTTCVAANTDGKKRMFLWGDSHAASMYPGIQHILKTQNMPYTLAQYTAGGCPPFSDYGTDFRKNCRANNTYIINKIRSLKPDTVVLSAYWQLYEEGKEPTDVMQNLHKTIALLKEMGVKHIVVIGQLPTWTLNAPKIAMTLWNKTGKLPTETKQFLDARSIQMNVEMQSLGLIENVTFISPTDKLCHDGLCQLTLQTTQGLRPMQWDDTHLSTEGSIWLISQIQREIFK